MPPVVIAAGIAAVGTIGGAVLSSSSQKSAAKAAAAAQTQATDTQLQLGRDNIAFQQGIYDKNTALLSPFVQRGNAAGGQINALLGLGGSPQAPQQAQPAAQMPAQGGYQTASPYTQQPLGAHSPLLARRQILNPDNQPDNYGMPQNAFANPVTQFGQVPAQAPSDANGISSSHPVPGASAQDAFNSFAHSAGIDFQLQQGTNALQNSAAARGLLQSGATLKALQGYGQNTALNNYFLPYMGLLQGQQATGAQSGAAIAGVGSNFGNTVSNIYGGQANAIQNGADATSNAALLRGQANANFGNSVGSALGNFASSFFTPGGGGYSPAGARY